jgi:hypothetical protein
MYPGPMFERFITRFHPAADSDTGFTMSSCDPYLCADRVDDDDYDHNHDNTLKHISRSSDWRFSFLNQRIGESLLLLESSEIDFITYL